MRACVQAHVYERTHVSVYMCTHVCEFGQQRPGEVICRQPVTPTGPHPQGRPRQRVCKQPPSTAPRTDEKGEGRQRAAGRPAPRRASPLHLCRGGVMRQPCPPPPDSSFGTISDMGWGGPVPQAGAPGNPNEDRAAHTGTPGIWDGVSQADRPGAEPSQHPPRRRCLDGRPVASGSPGRSCSFSRSALVFQSRQRQERSTRASWPGVAPGPEPACDG